MNRVPLRAALSDSEEAVHQALMRLDPECFNVVVLRYGLSGHKPVPLFRLCSLLEMNMIKVSTLHHAACLVMQNNKFCREALWSYLLSCEHVVERHADVLRPHLQKNSFAATRRIWKLDKRFFEDEDPFFVFSMHMYYDTPCQMVMCYLADKERLGSDFG